MGNFTCLEQKKTISQIPTYFPCTALNSQTISLSNNICNIQYIQAHLYPCHCSIVYNSNISIQNALFYSGTFCLYKQALPDCGLETLPPTGGEQRHFHQLPLVQRERKSGPLYVIFVPSILKGGCLFFLCEVQSLSHTIKQYVETKVIFLLQQERVYRVQSYIVNFCVIIKCEFFCSHKRSFQLFI